MPKIRMLTGLAGDDFSWGPGEIVDVEKPLADALCQVLEDGSRRAEPVEAEKRTTKATKATRPKGEER